MIDQGKTNAFIAFLTKLGTDENRAALATFRKGLGKESGSSMDMYRYLGPFLYEKITPWEEKSIFLTASLFALNPEHGGTGNMGSVFKRISLSTGSESIEKRFVALLESHPDDLADRLRHAVALSKSKGVPIDWNNLYQDIRHWSNPSGFVQKNWARAYWGYVKNENEGVR
jgi:CRISPR system Cascade subunit CasB